MRVVYLRLLAVLDLELLGQVLLGVAKRLRLGVEAGEVLSDCQIFSRLRLMKI